MTQRTTFSLDALSVVEHGIPSISYDDANSAVTLTVDGSETFWSGVRIDHKPEPGFTATSGVEIRKQSDASIIAKTTTTGNIELYYPNHPLHGNVNLTSYQGSMDWDTHYYMRIINPGSSPKRELVAIRKIIL